MMLIMSILQLSFISDKHAWKYLFFHENCQNAQCGKIKNLLSPKIISSNQHFSNFISANKIAFTKFLRKFCAGFLYFPQSTLVKLL